MMVCACIAFTRTSPVAPTLFRINVAPVDPLLSVPPLSSIPVPIATPSGQRRPAAQHTGRPNWSFRCPKNKVALRTALPTVKGMEGAPLTVTRALKSTLKESGWPAV